jgi:hypothetical protein
MGTVLEMEIQKCRYTSEKRNKDIAYREKKIKNINVHSLIYTGNWRHEIE